MKTFALISGLACLQQIAAVCCRSNNCWKAVGDAGSQGVADCSANLAVTVTPDAVTFTETASIATEYQTVVDTEAVTVTETVTASTETDVVVISETVTAATETDVVITTQTVVATQSNTLFVTVTPTTIIPWRRQATDTESAPPTLPTYPSECGSWKKYVAACSCAGVTPVTVTAEAPSTTVTVGTAGSVTESVLATLVSTTTVLDSVTATVTDTTTDVVSLTATALETQTVVVEETTTVETTQTKTTSAVASLITRDSDPFRAVITYNNAPFYMYANLMNNAGGVNWQPGSTSTAATIQNKYVWKIDSAGHVLLAYNVPPYSYQYAMYITKGPTGGNWPQVDVITNVQTRVTAGSVDWVYGAVDPATKRLYLNAYGRKNILWCGNQMWMSTALGEDINRGTCLLMLPTITAPVS